MTYHVRIHSNNHGCSLGVNTRPLVSLKLNQMLNGVLKLHPAIHIVQQNRTDVKTNVGAVYPGPYMYLIPGGGAPI